VIERALVVSSDNCTILYNLYLATTATFITYAARSDGGEA
jgi:hypothetical protein